MSSTVASLFAAVGLEPDGSVPWGTPVPETRTGVYVVSLTASTNECDRTYSDPPLSDAALDELIAVCPALSLDGEPNPSGKRIAERIGSYWLTDECVLYVGLAGQPLRTRVRQYYRTPIGAAKPHRGGWWLKTLSVLDEVHVHYAAVEEFKEAEEHMLREFAGNISVENRVGLSPNEPVMPFANLRDGNWRRRNHRIANATSGSVAQETKRRRASSTPARRTRTAAPISVSRGSAVVTPHHRSQNVTGNDIKSGQIRIPRGATKGLMPIKRGDITVLLRGRELTCRWDPRFGPPERSGVIRVGKAAAIDLLSVGDVLAVSVRNDNVAELD